MDSPNDAAKAPDRIKKIMDGTWLNAEINHIRKDGREFPIEMSAGLIELGKEKYILAFDRDITERKELEVNLRQATKMESIGTLAGGIAHDFNNILSSIIGFSELALDSVDEGSEVEDDLQEVRKAGMRAKDL
ncbi:MAG: PAS domain S-box protein, partial [Desulfobacula sp.]|nr:PAS domain S-box protein [Desulfobacula sp.]